MLSSCDIGLAEPEKVFSSIRKQRTLGNSASYSGIGLFTGAQVKMKFFPAPVDSGIVFKRVDLPDAPCLRACVENIWGTPRCTILGKESVHVQTVEHVLSALRAFEVDNLLIEVDGPEVPAADGSALQFVELIEKSDVVEQEGTTHNYYITSPVYWSEGDVHLVALPSKEFRVSYTLSYPNNPLMHSQFCSFIINPETYKSEIASCRTFSLYEEIVPLLEKGVIKGGNLDNGVIIKGNEVLNPGGLRFVNEPVRHKVLDLIGDLSLIDFPVIAHVLAIRSGHHSNTRFAEVLANHIRAECK